MSLYIVYEEDTGMTECFTFAHRYMENYISKKKEINSEKIARFIYAKRSPEQMNF